MIETRQGRQGLRTHLLHVVFVGGDLQQSGAGPIQLTRIAPCERRERGTARLEWPRLIASNVQQARGDLDAVAKQRGKNRVPADATVGARRDAEQVIGCFGWSNGAEIRYALIKGRCANVSTERDNVPISEVEHDANRSALTLLIRRVRVSIEVSRPRRYVSAPVATDTRMRLVAELHRPIRCRPDPISQWLRP